MYLPAVTLAPVDCVPPPTAPPAGGPPPPTEKVLSPNSFLIQVRGLSLLSVPPPPPPPPIPPRLARPPPTSASCSAVSCEAGLPKSSRPSRSSCGSGGVLESESFGASAKPVIFRVTVVGWLYVTL